MSVLLTEPALHALVPGGILAASLLGSAHCVGMCGGIVAGVAKDTKGLALYHLGRLASYTALGALSGALGAAVLGFPLPKDLGWVATTVFGVVLIAAGLRRFSDRPLHLLLPGWLGALPARLMAFVDGRTGPRVGIFALGFLSALLPCGWLYTFVFAAAATKSAALGAMALGFFWLGTVPALSAAPALFNSLTKRSRSVTPRLSGALLIAVGLFSLGLHATALVAKEKSPAPRGVDPAAPSCPLHHGH